MDLVAKGVALFAPLAVTGVLKMTTKIWHFFSDTSDTTCSALSLPSPQNTGWFFPQQLAQDSWTDGNSYVQVPGSTGSSQPCLL